MDRVDGPLQIVRDTIKWSMPVVDVSAEADARRAAEAGCKADLARPVWQMTRDAVRLRIVQSFKRRYFWYARYHHIVMDPFGMCLVARRVAEIYTQLLPEAPRPTIRLVLSDTSRRGSRI